MPMSSNLKVPNPDFGLDDVRAFVEQAHWHWATTWAQRAPHWYVLQRDCWERGTGREFAEFVAFIEGPAGYDRRWGSKLFRSFDGLDDGYYYWLPDEGYRVLINRALHEPEVESPQLSLEVER
jgi:hypothetical protein